MKVVQFVAVLATATLACGCSGGTQPQASSPSRTAATESSVAAANVPIDARRTLAEEAMRQGRQFAPAGGNAIEHYLAAQAQAPSDRALQVAIAGIQPYLLIACEQAIAGGDLDEADRLIGLIARSAPNAPALPRLQAALGTAHRDADAEAQRLATSNAADAAEEVAVMAAAASAVVRTGGVDEDARDVAVPATRADSGEGAVNVADAPPSAGQAASAPVDSAVPESAPAVPAPAAAAPVASGTPRQLRAAPPRYPTIAMHRGVEGDVEVAFTIRQDGTVGDARIVRAHPREVFDRAALAAVADYRFEPSGQSHSIAVTLAFRLSRRE